MSNHGTPTLPVYSDGQFATLASQVIVALPKAIKFSGLDIKAILRHSSDGARLSLAIAEALKMLYGGHVATVPVLGFSDSGAVPSIPVKGWRVSKHRRNLHTVFNPSEIQLYVSEKQQTGTSTMFTGSDLLQELQDKFVLNANYLDLLLKNQRRIPDEFRAYERIFFFGTEYINGGNDLYVRCLINDVNGWREGREWLGNLWNPTWAAAILPPDAAMVT